MNLEDERKQKQQYLRTQVLEKNYDPEEFILYLNNQLNIDSDIDRCSFQDLRRVVQDFLQEREDNIIESVGSLSSSQALATRRFEEKKSAVVFKESGYPVVEEQFEITHKCIKLASRYSPEEIHKIICQVSNPERKFSGGLLGIGATSFLEFQVTTEPMGWCVGRRYSDFIWLRNILRKFYPTQILPPIPEKKASKRTVRHIQKRMRILSYFLNDLIGLAPMLNCKYVQGFLSLKDSSKFDQLKREAEAKLSFQSISSLETESGFVRIALSNNSVRFCAAARQFNKRSETLYKQVTRASKRLQSHRVDEVNQLYELGNKFAELYECGKEFAEAKQCQGISHLNDIFIKLNNMMIEWGNNLKNEIDLLQLNFNTFFKYVRESCAGVQEGFIRLEELERIFISNKHTLDLRKQKVFLLHDPSRWQIPKKQIAFVPKASVHERTEAFKIMLPRESIEVQKQKTSFAFHLSQMEDHASRYFGRQAEQFNGNFRDFAIKNKVNNQQLGQSWNQMCVIFSEGCPNASKKLRQMEKISQYRESAGQILDD